VYYLDASRRFTNEVVNALHEHFGDSAEVICDDLGHPITVKILTRYEKELKEAPEGHIGGGLKESINGMKFEINIVEGK
jgi:hypothetical protein